MNKIIGIVSGKGGVGKTTLCANLAFALAAAGKKVIAIDGDIYLKNLDILLGMSDHTAYDLSDALSGKSPVVKSVQQNDLYPTLHFSSATQQDPRTPPDAQAFRKLCLLLRQEYDFVLIDAPAGIGGWVSSIIDCCDECIVVTTPDFTALRDAQRVAQVIREQHQPFSRLVINRVSPFMINRGQLQNVDDMMDAIAMPLLGLVPVDNSIVVYSNTGKSVISTKSACAGPFRNIADRLCGKQVPLDKYWSKNKNRRKTK